MDVLVRFGRGAGGGSGHVAAGGNSSSDPAGVAGGGRGTVDPAARALRGGFVRAASACRVTLTSNRSSSGPEATAAVPTKFAWVHDAATLEVWSRRPGRDGAALLRIDVVDLQGTDAGEVDSWGRLRPSPTRKLTVAGFPPRHVCSLVRRLVWPRRRMWPWATPRTWPSSWPRTFQSRA